MTLTQLKETIQKFAPLVVIFLLVVLIFYFSFRLLVLYANSGKQVPVNTKEQIKTDPTFGSITAPQIPDGKPSDEYTYILDTLDGTTNFETATSAATVYFVPKETPTFGFLSTIYNMASQFDIDTEQFPHVLDGEIATFDDGVRKLAIDITTYNFAFNRKIDVAEGLFDTSFLPRQDYIEREAQDLLRVLRYPSDLAQGTRSVSYFFYNVEQNQIEPVDTNEGANMVEVDFFRPDLGAYPFVTSSYFNSPHYVLYAINRSTLIPIRAQVAYYDYSPEKVGVYPLRTPDQAWEDLSKGKGLVVSNFNPNKEIRIQKIFLGYYEPDDYQEYIQPVYVFLGEDKFVAYVPAVSENFVAKPKSQ
ncbi:hypothetical protein KC726_04605 [Candidatus Woesebacteria bacterium]|nr:hypothetical protein [Candidatus Woesebacteria bacterium]